MLTDVLLRSLPPDIVTEYDRRRAIAEVPTDATADQYASAASRKLQNLILFIEVEVERREKCHSTFEMKQNRFDADIEENQNEFCRPHPPTLAVFQKTENPH